jgi:tRNA (guanine10-N2)-methyltransferase
VQKHPCVYVNLPGGQEAADKLVKRSILVKEILDVISEAKSYEQLLENVDKEKLFPLLESGKSFKFNIEGIGRKISVSEQLKIIESFSIFPFKQNINLKNPEMIFKIIENQDDHVIYFGIEMAKNRVEEDTYHYRFDLKKRPYLGPTSTDH